MKSSQNKRADVWLVEKGFCETRSQARRLIVDGKVHLDGERLDKSPIDRKAPTKKRTKKTIAK
ncbi:MAG: hypothetical protein A2Y14_03910 [Verrucomicrobia bacterium GWF2_51_19]|nr:MAG: hypothetical protein A2Y14_03910 [Verrucomicrobia bacterium GWF2_51_19]